MDQQTPNASQLLKTYTGSYDPPSALASYWMYNRRRPWFHPLWHVPAMMTESRILMALWYIKGTILSLSRFYVDSDENPEIKEFVIDQITRWWRNSSIKQMTAIEWGYSGHEVMYALRNQMISFDSLRTIGQRDVRAVTQQGSLVGICIENNIARGKLYLGGPKSLWHVHWREYQPWYGRSRLYGAYDPWREMVAEGGARDIRRLYFHKYAFAGETIYHPPGSHQMENGQYIPYKDIARDILEKMRTGGVVALPSVFDPATNNRLWELVQRQGDSAATDVLEYHEQLKKEMSEGLGVPQELIEASETGSGYSGRKVPQNAFRGMLSDIVYWLVSDFNEQVLIPLVRLNFGVSEPQYEIIPFGLVRDSEENLEDPMGNGAIQAPDTQAVPNQSVQQAQFSLVV